MLFRRSVHEIMRQIYQVLWRINCWTFLVSFVICTDFLVGYTWASASFFIVLLKCAAGIVCCWLSAFLPNLNVISDVLMPMKIFLLAILWNLPVFCRFAQNLDFFGCFLLSL